MRAYQITGRKDFMNRLLTSESFDCFLMEEGMITTFNTFTIDGRIHREFYSTEEKESPSSIEALSCDFSFWKDIRPLCFQLIRGKRTPLNFKFVLLLVPEQMEQLLIKEDFDNSSGIVKHFTLTVKYDGSAITLVTGISTETFLMDKTPDRLWDSAFSRFLAKKEIAFEEDPSISSFSG